MSAQGSWAAYWDMELFIDGFRDAVLPDRLRYRRFCDERQRGRPCSTSARLWAAGLRWTGGPCSASPATRRPPKVAVSCSSPPWSGGSGTKAQSVNRRACIFEHSSPADIAARLSEALDVLRERGAADAYWSLNNDQRIPHLGPAFFTKVLYFAGYDSAAAPHRPVTLDSVVSRALKANGAVDTSWPESGWTTDQYLLYVDGVHEYAQERGVLPDQVKAAPFSHGKQSA